MEVQLHAFLISVLYGGEWSAALPGRRFTLGKNPSYPSDRRMGGTRWRNEKSLSQLGTQPVA